MKELLSTSIFINGVLISILLSILYGLISFFIVQRKMVFLGTGIAHTAFGGVALGLVLSVHPLISALVFCSLTAIIMSNLVRSGQIHYDAGIGIFFTFSMALGSLFIALKNAYTFDLSGYLFGNILGITTTDIYLAFGALLLFLIFLIFYFHKLIFIAFDETVARISGVPVLQLDTILLVFLALIIVLSMKIVGIILVSALVVLPTSFGKLFSKKYQQVIFFSILYTIFMMSGGLFLSFFLNTPAGATMVVFGTLIYFISFCIIRVTKNN